MPLLDGKYEIIAERPLEKGQTLFDATAPDGTAVRVVWFDLASPAEEASFERYRRLLKRLRREGHAAIYDLVSRPGAHYVAWHSPSEATPIARLPGELRALLDEHGIAAEEVEARALGQQVKLYALAFDGTLPAPPPSAPAPKTVIRKRTLAERYAALPEWAQRTLPGLLLALLGLMMVWSSFYLRANDQLVTVPAFVGEDVNAAATALHALGLEVVPEAVASDATPGAVIGSSPPAGTLLRPGRTVYVRYALPAGALADTEVPELRGLTLAEAEATLNAARLELGHVAHLYAPEPLGTVLAQSHPPQGTISQGTHVDVLVSDGPKRPQTFVPDLRGLDLELARTLIRDVGFTGEIEEAYVSRSDQVPGTVLSQSVTPYMPIPLELSSIRLEVAGTPDPGAAAAHVPTLSGLPLDEARRVAEQAGYSLEIEEMSSFALPQSVIEQSPPPGSASETRTLRLLVNVHPQPLPRPEVTVEVRPPQLRRIPYAWPIEPGIPSRRADVFATTLDGEEILVASQQVQGGEVVEGEWLTTTPGPVTFRLLLNGIPYGEPQRRNP